MFDRKKKKSILIGMVTFLILTGCIILFLRNMDENVFQILGETGLSMLVTLAAFSFSLFLMDSMVYHAAFSDLAEGFSLRHGLALTGMRVFGRTALIGGGTMPLQSYYLYKKGVAPGRSIGIVTVLYIIQKTAIVLYASVLLCFRGKWVMETVPGARGFLIFSYLMCLIAISVLLLLCTSGRVCHAVQSLIGKLPESGKWPGRKEKWNRQIGALYEETHALLSTKRKFAGILMLNAVRLFLYDCIPFAVAESLGLTGLSLMQAQTLNALMMLFSNALPNIAGMGSVEFSFLLVFSEVLGPYASAALIYYRCATYYFPFLLSIPIILVLQKKAVTAKWQSM